tara:strand:+ start:1259 stop:1588 length:330 start_codon:yes stop_codon:yes gene_type:complete
MIHQDYQIDEVHVYPELNGRQNVIERVVWILNFHDGDFTSSANIETYLEVSGDLDDFIDADDVTDEQIYQWVLEKQGGNAFLDMLLQMHTENLTELKKQAQLVQLRPGL